MRLITGLMLGVTHHLEEDCRRDSHPVQLDLEGSIQGEVAMVIAAAPLGAITAIIHINVQGDRLLLRHSGSCYEKRATGKRQKKKGEGGRNTQERRERNKEKQRAERSVAKWDEE